jgi:uncharacterized protein (DUF2225 family)
MTFSDFVSDRVRVCPHCGLTMMRSDFRGACGGQGCESKQIVPPENEWREMFVKFMEAD